MAMKIYGDKIVFPDNSEQTTAPDPADTSYTKSEIDAQQEAQDVQIESKVPEAPDDGETYARNNEKWVGISDSSGIPDAPVDDVMYGRKNGEWDPVADAGDIYTKSEIDSQQKIQDTAIVENNDDIARQQIEISNQQTSIDKNSSDIDTDSARIATNTTNISTNTGNISSNTTAIEANDAKIVTNSNNISTNSSDIAKNTADISSNTTAIGTLSGQVNQNSEDIAELQDSIFFTSAYTADYPSVANRDPNAGNMYLQKFAQFTYSYADATQIFCSKTDESGNVRQFTAIKEGDSIVLNQVDSPNYGRYELVSVEDVGDYVMMVVDPKLAEGTIIEGVKVAFQAFPKPDSGDSLWTDVGGDAVYDGKAIATFFQGDGSLLTGLPDSGIPEAPIDGKEYARKDADWTEVEALTPTPLVWTNELANRALDTVYTNATGVPKYVQIYVACTGIQNVNFKIDGVSFGYLGNSDADSISNQTPLFVVPAGSTYELATGAGVPTIVEWHEAKMPVAVAGDGVWTENAGVATYDGVIQAVRNGNNMYMNPDFRGEGNISTLEAPNKPLVLTSGDNEGLRIDTDGAVSTTQDITVNGMTVGYNDTLKSSYVGTNALANIVNGMFNTAIGESALANADSGAYNTAIGYSAGTNITSGNNVTCIGYMAEPSAPDVTNEITLGNPDVTVVRMGNGTPLTTTTYVNEEIAKKDKLINKLTERLDALELKFKALK